MKLLQHRPGIQQGRTGFDCQSQGCWVVPVALRNGVPAHFAVMQSGPAVSVAEEDLDLYRVTLTSKGFGPLEIEAAFALIRISHQVSLGNAISADLEAAIAKFRDQVWFKELGFSRPPDEPECVFERRTLAYDPGTDIDAIRIPSLWIYGDADTIIPVQASLDKVRQASSSPRPEIRVLRDAGHSFTVGKTTIPRLAGEYPGLVIEWINSRH